MMSEPASARAAAAAPIASIVLAGGASRRMGRAKALLPFPAAADRNFVEHLAEACCAAGCAPAIVVLGHEPEAVLAASPRLRALHTTVVVNRDWERGGQLSSLQAGLRAVPDHCEAVLFCPVDYGLVRAETFAAVVEAAAGNPAAMLVYPRCRGRKGHPVAIRRELVREILALPQGASARQVTAAHAGEALFVEVGDEAILRDVDTPEDLASSARGSGARR